jgi:transcriptional regulator with XRE-family HTH domain
MPNTATSRGGRPRMVPKVSTAPARPLQPVTQFVANKLRQLRVMSGLSQEQLAKAIGVSFQQLQKYERGINRLSPDKLWATSNVCGVPVGYFFEGLPIEGQTQLLQDPPQEISLEAADLLRSFNKMSPEQQRAIRTLATTMVEGGSND